MNRIPDHEDPGAAPRSCRLTGGVRLSCLILLAITASGPAAADTLVREFSGQERQTTAAFSVAAPWLASWQTRQPALGVQSVGQFEVYLYDADTDRFVGKVTEWSGSGSGDVLIEQGGRFRFEVLAQTEGWRIRVRQITPEAAAALKAAREAADFRLATPRGVSRHQIGALRAWRALDDRQLILETTDGRSFRATFSESCPGLDQAQRLSLISGSAQDWDEYSGILLEDGTICRFDRVVAEPRLGR